MAVLHLGSEPHWIRISGRVDFPEDIKRRYTELVERCMASFDSDFPRQLFGRTFRVTNMIVQPQGLANRNLMCFANASIQLLFASPYFVNFSHFMRMNLPLLADHLRELVPAWCAFCSFLSKFKFIPMGGIGGGSMSIKSLDLLQTGHVTDLSLLDPFFGPYKSTRHPLTQEDAVDFLMFFMTVLHEELLKLTILGKPADDEGDGEWFGQGTGRGHMKIRETQGDMSPLSDIFSTVVRAETLQGGRSRNLAKESFLVLLLQVRGMATIEDAIAAFEREEEVPGSERVSKKNSFMILPKSLILGLKRFYYDRQAKEPVKMCDFIEYSDTLSIASPLGGAPVEYQLSAIVEHQGRTAVGGHYVCVSRRFDGTWLRFDDQSVKVVRDEGHLGLQAYLLLYNQIG